MRIAETTSRSLLIGLGVVLGATVAITAWTCEPPVAAKARSAGPSKMKACGAARRAAVKPVPPPTKHNVYADALVSVRPQLLACMTGQQVDVRLVLNISAAGQLDNLEVTTRTDDMPKIDLGVLACLQEAVAGVEFPTSTDEVKLSTHLRAAP